MSYQSSEIKKKRVTFKKSKENQYIKKLLKDLYSKIVEKDSRTSKQIEQALASLSKYPLPIYSGEDCFILQGFNKNLCNYVDKKIFDALTFADDESEPSLPELKTSKSMEIQPTEQISIKLTTKKSNSMKSHSETNTNFSFSVEKKTDVILLALNKQKLMFPERPSLNVKELKLRVQNLVDSTITDWGFLKTLIEQGTYIKTEFLDGIQVCSVTDLGEQLFKGWRQTTKSKILDDSISWEDCIENRDYDYRRFLYSKYPELEPSWVVTSLNTVQNDIPMFIDMPPGSYDVVMLVDKNEPEMLSCKSSELTCESRTLKVGDVMWLARSKTNSQELVLPYILERKRMDDFAASIKDGRFHEQKFRLRKCGIKNVIYLIEDHPGKKHCGLSMATLNQARVNTRVQDGFLVHHTSSTNYTRKFLNMMTQKLTRELHGVRLRGCNVNSGGRDLMTYEYFNSTSSKTKPLTIKSLFIKMLLQLKGLSVEKALAITNVYSSPSALMEAYNRCDPRDAELLLANLKFNATATRVSPALSKIIYIIFHE